MRIFLPTFVLAVASRSPNSFAAASTAEKDEQQVDHKTLRHRRHVLEVESTVFKDSFFLTDDSSTRKSRDLSAKTKSNNEYSDLINEWDRLLQRDMSMSMSMPTGPSSPVAPPSEPVPTPTGTSPPVAPPSEPPVAPPTEPTAPVAPPSEPTTPSPAPIAAPVPEPTTVPVPTIFSPVLFPPTEAPATTPTTAPFKECRSVDRALAILTAVSKVTPNDGVLNNSTSPQGFAVNWLINDDSLQIDPCTYPTVEQRYSLATLFASTVGDSWLNKTGWLSGVAECEWFAVVCNADGRVERLELRTYATLLKFTPIVTDLWFTTERRVQILTFLFALIYVTEQNNLEGSIPDELRAMPALQSLDFYKNALAGTLPTVLNELTDLMFLDVEENQLTGPAFVDVTGLTKLATYRVSINALTGTVPERWWPDRAPSALTELWFAQNFLVGTLPDTIGVHTQLSSLIFNGNTFTGSLPSELGQLNMLEQLQAQDNKFTSTIPIELYNNKLLRVLRLDKNLFTGTLASQIGDLKDLEDLRIGDNAFSGTLPAQIAKLSNLGTFSECSDANEIAVACLPSS